MDTIKTLEIVAIRAKKAWLEAEQNLNSEKERIRKCQAAESLSRKEANAKALAEHFAKKEAKAKEAKAKRDSERYLALHNAKLEYNKGYAEWMGVKRKYELSEKTPEQQSALLKAQKIFLTSKENLRIAKQYHIDTRVSQKILSRDTASTEQEDSI